MTGSSPHVVVLSGGGYAHHAAHEGEPIARWLRGLGVAASVFRYPLMVRHPAPLEALRTEIRRLRDGGSTRIGVVGFSAGGHLAGLAALAEAADADEAVDFAVLGYAITSMETETYRPARLILLGEDATPELRRATSLDALVTPRGGQLSRRRGSENRVNSQSVAERSVHGSHRPTNNGQPADRLRRCLDQTSRGRERDRVRVPRPRRR